VSYALLGDGIWLALIDGLAHGAQNLESLSLFERQLPELQVRRRMTRSGYLAFFYRPLSEALCPSIGRSLAVIAFCDAKATAFPSPESLRLDFGAAATV
jgi:hypothetical protein